METLKVSTIVCLEEVKIIASVAGLTKTDIKIKSDSETHELFITTSTPKKLDAVISDTFTFEKYAKIQLDSKYEVKNSVVSVTNGILLITVPVSEDRINTIAIN